MPTVSSVARLNLEIEKKLRAAMESKVADIVSDVMSERIQTDVLQKYRPKYYERRSFGGIDDPNMNKTQVRKNRDGRVVLTVKNVAKLEGPRVPGYYANDSFGTPLVSLLDSNNIANPWSRRRARWQNPRHFMSNTRYYVIKRKGDIIKALAKELNK